MIFKKTAVLAMLLAAITAFASCQLSELNKKDDADSQKETDTSAPEVTEKATLEDFIPEGVDIDYVMDYMNEDLSGYITLGEYKGLSAEVETYEVNEEYISGKIDELLMSEAVPSKITDRKTAEGDVICVDYVGTLDGVAFGGGSAKDVSITLKENSGYIPGFVDGMYDVMPGETVSYDVTFPSEYPNNPDLAGKKTVFTVTIHYIEGEKVAPELNDDFVKAHFGAEGCETVEEFMSYYEDFLETERAESAKQDATHKIWQQIMENVTVIELPQKAVDALYWLNRANYEMYAQQYGVEYEEFLSTYVGQSDEALKKFSEDYVKEDLVIYSIVKAEGLQITDEEYAEGIVKFKEQYNMTEEELIEEYSKEKIVGVLQWNKLIEEVYKWSEISETVK